MSETRVTPSSAVIDLDTQAKLCDPDDWASEHHVIQDILLSIFCSSFVHFPRCREFANHLSMVVSQPRDCDPMLHVWRSHQRLPELTLGCGKGAQTHLAADLRILRLDLCGTKKWRHVHCLQRTCANFDEEIKLQQVKGAMEINKLLYVGPRGFHIPWGATHTMNATGPKNCGSSGCRCTD